MPLRAQLVDSREPDGVSPTDPIWSRLRSVIRALNGSTIIDGRMLDAEPNAAPASGLIFTSGQVRSIPHKLGRPARGFFEVYLADAPSAAHVGLFVVAHPPGFSSEHYITIKATAAGACAVWVF